MIKQIAYQKPSATSILVVPSDAIATNGGFETGDLTGWKYESYGAVNQTSITVVSPGHNSNYVAHLTAAGTTSRGSSSSGADYMYQSVAVIPGVTYTLYVDYNQDAGSTCMNSEASLYFNVEDNKSENSPISMRIVMAQGNSTDSLGNSPASWSTVSKSFVAPSNSYSVYATLQNYGTCFIGVQLDNFKLIASNLPPPPGTPYPSCDYLPNAPFKRGAIFQNPITYGFDTFSSMRIVPDGDGSTLSSIFTDSSLTSCQAQLVEVMNNGGFSAQYNNATHVCSIYNVPLCGQPQLLVGTADDSAIQVVEASK